MITQENKIFYILQALAFTPTHPILTLVPNSIFVEWLGYPIPPSQLPLLPQVIDLKAILDALYADYLEFEARTLHQAN